MPNPESQSVIQAKIKRVSDTVESAQAEKYRECLSLGEPLDDLGLRRCRASKTS